MILIAAAIVLLCTFLPSHGVHSTFHCRRILLTVLASLTARGLLEYITPHTRHLPHIPLLPVIHTRLQPGTSRPRRDSCNSKHRRSRQARGTRGIFRALRQSVGWRLPLQ